MTEDEALAVLGITRSASDKEVADAYRALAEIYHPDRYGSASAKAREEAARRMSRLNEAYDVIKRARAGSASGGPPSSNAPTGPSASGGSASTEETPTRFSGAVGSHSGGMKVVGLLLLVGVLLTGFFVVRNFLDRDGGPFEGAQALYDELGCTRFLTGGPRGIDQESDPQGYSFEQAGCRLEDGTLVIFVVWEEDGRVDAFLDLRRRACLDSANSELSYCGFHVVGPNWSVKTQTRSEAEHVQDIVGGTIREVSRR